MDSRAPARSNLPQTTRRRMFFLLCQICARLYKIGGQNPLDPWEGGVLRALFWRWGYWYLQYIWLHRSRSDRQWKAFFILHGVTPQTYDQAWVSHDIVVYVKKSHIFPKHTYTGATEHTASGRESSRRRTFRAMSQDTNNVEPSIRWWYRTHNFYEFVPIVLSHHHSYLEATTKETQVTVTNQTILNTPWVNDLLPSSTKFSLDRLDKARDGEPGLGVRLYRRFRQAALWEPHGQSHIQLQGPTRNNVVSWPQSWTQHDRHANLRMVTEPGVSYRHGKGHSAFGLERWLRGPLVTPLTLYSLLRATVWLAQPAQGWARFRITRLLTQMGLPVPPPVTKPMVLPALPIQDAAKVVRKFVQQLIHKARLQTVPLHYPRPSLVEGAWKSIARSLYNNKDYSQLISTTGHLGCNCHFTKSLIDPAGLAAPLPGETFQHVAGPATLLLRITPPQHKTVRANAKETIFPDPKKLVDLTSAAIVDFFKNNRLSMGAMGGPEQAPRIARHFPRRWTQSQNRTRVAAGASVRAALCRP